MNYFLLAILSFALGYFVRSKERGVVRVNNLPGYKNAPPPPPPPHPPKPILKHIKPGIMYDSCTFVRVHQCKNCKIIGHSYDLLAGSPCPYCGGGVERLSTAAKWEDKKWIFATIDA